MTMEILTFRAKSLREARQLVQHELVPDDTAVAPSAPMELQRGTGIRHIGPVERSVAGIGGLAAGPLVGSWIPPADHHSFRDQAIRSARQDALGSHSLVEQLCGTGDDPNSLPESFFHVFARLLDIGFEESVARELLSDIRPLISVSSVPDEQQIWSKLISHVKSAIRIAGPIQIPAHEQRVVAVVGPTGVGKTTTIAKLAAEFRLKQRRRVGLVTLDTYRIAAVDQLRAYAEIMDLPLEIVTDPRGTREAVARLSDQDLVLIDTAGRNPFDDLPLNELKATLQAVQPHEIQLVLSTTAAAKSLIRIVERFQCVGVTSTILSKLDEASCPQDLVSVIRNCGCSISYTTDGQSVPDNLAVADRDQLARLIFRSDRYEVVAANAHSNEAASAVEKGGRTPCQLCSYPPGSTTRSGSDPVFQQPVLGAA